MIMSPSEFYYRIVVGREGCFAIPSGFARALSRTRPQDFGSTPVAVVAVVPVSGADDGYSTASSCCERCHCNRDKLLLFLYFQIESFAHTAVQNFY